MGVDFEKLKEVLFNKTLNRITIDIDNYKDVPKVLYKAIHYFGKDKVSLFVSPSGTGFRVLISGRFSLIENIVYRSILGDDPYRLRYAISRFALTLDCNVLDIAFVYKASFRRYFGKVKNVDIDEVYDEDYGKCLKKLLKVMKPLKRYIVVVEDDKVGEKLKDLIGKYNLIRDPYHENRKILVFVTNDDSIIEEIKNRMKVHKIVVSEAYNKENGDE